MFARGIIAWLKGRNFAMSCLVNSDKFCIDIMEMVEDTAVKAGRGWPEKVLICKGFFWLFHGDDWAKPKGF